MGAVRERAHEQPQTVRHRRGWPLAGAALLAVPLLLFCYLRIAGTTSVNADAAGLVLQANDMLHGNLLLHGWWDTDVSFITTELPEYMAVTAAAGIRPEVVHICAAVTYTLLVLLAAGVARGRARGAEGAVRALLGAGVMLAPQPVWTTPVMLGSPDHVGTAVPLLLLLLLLDRVPPSRFRLRWYIPACGGVCVVTAAVLAAVMVGDPLAEVVGVVPLVIACLLRAVRIVVVRLTRAWRARTGGEAAPTVPDAANRHAPESQRAQDSAADTSWRAACYHVLLAASAAAAVPLAGAANAWIRRHGGYQLGPNRYGLLPWHQIVANAPTVWQSFLALFGADYTGVTGWNVVIALAHLFGVAIVIVAVAFAAWRLLVPGRAARAGDLIADFLVLAVLLNVVAFLAFVKPVDIYDAHEIGPVASFGAALAGRMLGGPLLRFRLPRLRIPVLRPVLVVVLAAMFACYAGFLGVGAAMPQGPPQHVALANWLSQHNLRSGLASYWESASVTVESGGKITMLAVGIHGWKRLLGPDAWETDVLLADPATHSANFLVVGPDQIVPAKLAIQMFGKPARTYQFAPYTIMVWNKNLIAELNH